MINFSVELTGIVSLMLATVLSSEMLLRCPARSHAKDLKVAVRKAFSILRLTNCSELRKEKALLAFGVRIMKLSVKFPAWILISLLPIFASVWFRSKEGNFVASFFDYEFLIILTLMMVIYGFMRKVFHEALFRNRKTTS